MDSRIGTEEEVLYAERAIAEEEEAGSTEMRCLRCGGRYSMTETGASYVIACENGDAKFTFRGI